MGYFHEEKNVLEYIKMVAGYDGAELIEILKEYLPAGSTVLELGMGPGVDLDILSSDYTVTGSDYSNVFLDLYRKKNKNADLLLIDATTLETDRKFDCIYSNKVLIHLKRQELKISLNRQPDILNPGGIVFHTFWKGDKTEDKYGIHFEYYTKNQLTSFFQDTFEILEIKTYTEMEKDDSIFVIGKKC
jgi:cyclopropane fatty-acyl-phospholipid synthase-like methyltransferase